MGSLADRLSAIEKQLKTDGPKQKNAPPLKPRAKPAAAAAPRPGSASTPAAAAQPVADGGGDDSGGKGAGGKRERGGAFKGTVTGFQLKALEPAAGMSAAEAREAPVGKVVKDVLACLRNHRGYMTAKELQDVTRHDVHSPLVLQHLDISKRCAREQTRDKGAVFKYLPRHPQITSRGTLLDFVRYHKKGTYVQDIDDSYAEVSNDIEALKAEGRIVLIEDPEKKDSAIFWCDMMGVEVCADLVKFFHSPVVKVPEELQELQAAVTKAGLRSHIAAQPLRRPMSMLPKERKKKARAQRINLEKATNKHLPEMLIKHQNAASIDHKG